MSESDNGRFSCANNSSKSNVRSTIFDMNESFSIDCTELIWCSKCRFNNRYANATASFGLTPGSRSP
jgi:hypothetical protein